MFENLSSQLKLKVTLEQAVNQNLFQVTLFPNINVI